jgi:hypothetical protein
VSDSSNHSGATRGTASVLPRPATADQPMPVAGAPSDNTTLMAVIEGLEAMGFADQMSVTEDAFVQCHCCSQRNDPHDVIVHELRRLEGASDPADMMMVIGAVCPICSCRGTLVMGYGPNTSGAEDQVILALRDGRPVPDLS